MVFMEIRYMYFSLFFFFGALTILSRLTRLWKALQTKIFVLFDLKYLPPFEWDVCPQQFPLKRHIFVSDFRQDQLSQETVVIVLPEKGREKIPGDRFPLWVRPTPSPSAVTSWSGIFHPCSFDSRPLFGKSRLGTIFMRVSRQRVGGERKRSLKIGI